MSKKVEKDNDDVLDKLSKEEIAVLSETWMEASLHSIFEEPNINGYLKGLSRWLANSKLSGISGRGWGFMDALTSCACAHETLSELQNGTDSKNLKRFYVSLDISLTAFILGSSAVFITARFATLGVGIAGLMTFSAGTAFAAFCWSMCVASIIELIQTVRQLKSPQYLFTRLVKKMEETPDQQKKDALKQQLLSLYRVHKNKIHLPDLKKHRQLPTKEEFDKDPTEADEVIVSLMETQLRDKAITRSVNTAQWVIAAVAMTFFALAPFCPYLLIPAFALTGAAILIRLGQMMVSKIGNHIARKAMLQNFDTELNGKTREEIAFELNKKYNPDRDNAKDWDKFENTLNQMSKWRRKLYLRGAYNRYTDDLILKRALGSDEMNTSFTKKERSKIVSQYCRNEFQLSKIKNERTSNVEEVVGFNQSMDLDNP